MEIILKIIGVLCVISITTLITNKNDEDVATRVLIFAVIALVIIFIPWGNLKEMIFF